MIVVGFLAIFTLLSFYAGAWVRKHSSWLYLGALALAILAFIVRDHPLVLPIMQGFVGLSLFYLVMMAGALPTKFSLRRTLMGVRKEYSILGTILITPHALHYLLQALQGVREVPWFGVIAFFFMIPLFITSFVRIRKKMKPKHWKMLQSLAYLIYLLLFIHLILNYTKVINLVLYLMLFLGYFGCKAVYEIQRFRLKQAKRLTK